MPAVLSAKIHAMKSLVSSTTLKRVFLSAVAASSLLAANDAFGQVNGPGPSDSSLFTNVFNLPSEDIGNTRNFGGVAGETTQINLSNGGSLSGGTSISSGVELNVDGGTVNSIDLFPDSEFNVSGGNFVSITEIRGSEANISGGSFSRELSVSGNLNLSGGIFESIAFFSERRRIYQWRQYPRPSVYV